MMNKLGHGGTLYVIATPIGNLEDITLRALRYLREVDLIYCEDTRITKRLLDKYDISDKVLRSLNARTEERKLEEVINELKSGKSVAYLSDAGTPGISDPGVRLVSAVRKYNDNLEEELRRINIIGVPGASALTTALSIAGVPTNKFVFYGFLPQKKGRQTLLKEIGSKEYTVVFYESTHRILKLLNELDEYMPNKHITLARELTKTHEETLVGSADELLELLNANPQKQKGEFVVIVSE